MPTPFPYKTLVDFTPRIDPFKDLPKEWFDPYAREEHASVIDARESAADYRRQTMDLNERNHDLRTQEFDYKQDERQRKRLQQSNMRDALSSIDPNSSDVLGDLLGIAFQTGDFDSAVDIFKAMQPDDPEQTKYQMYHGADGEIGHFNPATGEVKITRDAIPKSEKDEPWKGKPVSLFRDIQLEDGTTKRVYGSGVPGPELDAMRNDSPPWQLDEKANRTSFQADLAALGERLKK